MTSGESEQTMSHEPLGNNMPIDTLNRFVVGAIGGKIAIVFPPREPMEPKDALLLAAFLVSIADPTEGHTEFQKVLQAVQR